jgi:hypothetical protein
MTMVRIVNDKEFQAAVPFMAMPGRPDEICVVGRSTFGDAIH